MDIALTIVDILAGNQHPPARKNRIDWKCWKYGLTAGKDRNYQRSSKGKLRHFVPADWVYYIQSAYDIQMTRTMEQEVSVMCNLSKGVREKGVAEGMTNAVYRSIKNLVKNMGVTAEQAMSILEIPEAERKKYMDLLEQ